MTETATEWRWPFQVGDKVTCRGNWGILTDALRAHSEQNPGAIYEVCWASGSEQDGTGGRWIALKDEQGHVYGEPGSGFGHSYFRIAGECGEHVPGYDSARGGRVCLRCDEPLSLDPEAERLAPEDRKD